MVHVESDVCHSGAIRAGLCLSVGRLSSGEAHNSAAKVSTMCVHPERDVVSRFIKQKGRWSDCEKLPVFWNNLTTFNQHQQETLSSNPHPIYVEIGANIGSCVMEMLLSTDAPHIVAFEPNPRNLFCLTSTLLKMDESYRDRVSLFPIGLGNVPTQSVIFGATSNLGNSVVGKQVGDTAAQQFHQGMPISIEVPDSIFFPEHITTTTNANNNHHKWTVPLLKMDAQGYECYIMQGMPRLLERTLVVRTEVAPNWLTSFDNCSVEIFEKLFVDAGFEVGGAFRRKGAFWDVVAKKKGVVVD